MEICKTCVLPETFPGIKFNADGICTYCQNFKGREALDKQREQYRRKFESLLTALCPSFSTQHSSLSTHNSSLITDSHHSSLGSYDVLVAYSGGKDSTFTLDLIKNRFGLRVLALTFDHGFVSPYALENIRRVVENLGVDHITFKPNQHLIRKVFSFSLQNEFHPPKALERASSICNSCMGLVKFITLRVAIEKRIPFVAYGWSPGQAPMQSAILRNHSSFLKKSQGLFLKPLEKAAGPDVKAYFLEDHHLDSSKSLPYNINPLAFFPYDEGKIYRRIQELGWLPPKDTDPNSTNCLLNAFANQAHLERHHYHPYAMEMAELVREGVVSREEALQRLTEEPDRIAIGRVRGKLGL